MVGCPVRLALLCAAVASAACATTSARPTAVPPLPGPSSGRSLPSTPSPVPLASAPDPVSDLVATSVAAEARAQRELQDGHQREAGHAFDDALDMLLTAPAEIRRAPAVADRIERLVTRVSALELDTLERQPKPAPNPDGSPLDSVLAAPTFAPPDPVTTSRVTEDLTHTPHDIDIPLNARVLSFVELFTGKLKGFLEEALGRSVRYLPMIQRALTAEGLPTDLAFIPLVESAFNPNALSRANARGLWQFMRGTAVENGLRHNWYVDERAEPERATLAAARYLKTLHDMFGDWHLAIASYNGGPGRVQRALKQSGKTDFWMLSANSRYLPRETRDYVPLILAAAIVARNPGQYGLTVPPVEALPDAELVQLQSPVDLRRLAEALERPVTELQTLNPALRRWVTPPGPDGYQLRVPAGSSQQVSAFLASADATEDAAFLFHTARKGDTLASLANRLKVSRQDLADANFLPLRAVLRPGQRLIIPRAPGGLATAVQAPADDARPVSRPKVSATRPGAAASVTHIVRKGDTLATIARRYRTTVAELRRWNKNAGGRLTPGDHLTIRSPANRR